MKVVLETPTASFRLNDSAVPQESASIGPFLEIAHVKANHSTIASPATAEIVLGEIRRIQPMPPDP